MMNRNFAVFDSSIEDDSIESQQGDIVSPAGKNILEALRVQIGKNCGEVRQHSFYGWNLELKSPNGMKAELLLQCPHRWLLIVKLHSGLFVSKNKKDLEMNELIDIVDEALLRIKGIKSRIWLTEEEFNHLPFSE